MRVMVFSVHLAYNISRWSPQPCLQQYLHFGYADVDLQIYVFLPNIPGMNVETPKMCFES